MCCSSFLPCSLVWTQSWPPAQTHQRPDRTCQSSCPTVWWRQSLDYGYKTRSMSPLCFPLNYSFTLTEILMRGMYVSVGAHFTKAVCCINQYLSMSTRSSLRRAHFFLGQKTLTRQPASRLSSMCSAWASWLTVCENTGQTHSHYFNDV